MTNSPHRVLLIIPAAQQAAVITFWDTIDPGQGAATWNVPLNASGDPKDAPSAYWISTALTDVQITAIVRKLAQMASITVPSGASLNTKAAKLAWISANLAALTANIGVYIVRDDEDGGWSDPTAALAARGLKVIASGAGA